MAKTEINQMYDFSAECATVSAMVLDPRVIGDVLSVCGAGDLWDQKNAALFSVIVSLWERDPNMIDAVHIQDEIARRKMDIDTAYFIRVCESCPSPASGPYYARIVKSHAIRRRIVDVCHEARSAAMEPDCDITETLADIESKVMAIAPPTSAGMKHLGEILDDIMAELEARESGAMVGLPTGFQNVDFLVGGLQPGHLCIVAARPGMGKTSFAMNICEHVAIARQKTALFVSLEMSRTEVGYRLLSSQSHVPMKDIKKNTIPTDRYPDVEDAIQQLSQSRLLIDDQAGSFSEITARCRRMVDAHHPDLLVIDYLQLMHMKGRQEARHLEVANMSRQIKLLAGQMGIPIILICQLNRAAEARHDKRPQLSDLRESGAIEQDADLVMMLYRESYYANEDKLRELESTGKLNDAEVILAKNRHGPTGTAKLRFEGEIFAFHNPMY